MKTKPKKTKKHESGIGSDKLKIKKINIFEAGEEFEAVIDSKKSYFLRLSNAEDSFRYKAVCKVAKWIDKNINSSNKEDKKFQGISFLPEEDLSNKECDEIYKKICNCWYEFTNAEKIRNGKTYPFALSYKEKGSKEIIVNDPDEKLQFAKSFFKKNKEKDNMQKAFFWLVDHKKKINFHFIKHSRHKRKKKKEESWISKYKTNLLKKLNAEDEFQEGRFIEIDVEQKIIEKSKEQQEKQDNEQEEYQDVDDFIKEANSKDALILLGEVGSGKTTTLRHYLKVCLDSLDPDDPNPIIPVFIPLKRYKKYPDISSLVMVSVNEYLDVLPPNKVTFDINDFNFSFIFDGLDEVPYEFRDDAVDELKCALNQKKKVIISCRLKDYGDNFNNIQYYRLKELTDNQIKKHLKPFFKKDALVVFKQKIKQEQNIHNMARNPFLLDIIIEILEPDPEADLPDNKGGLIEKFVKIIIDKSKREKTNIPDVDEEVRDVFLGFMAFYMIDNGTSICYSDDRLSIRKKWHSIRKGLDSEDKIKTILLKAEAERLLKSGSSDKDIEFINPFIKDYFAAYYLSQIDKDTLLKRMDKELLESSKWNDVISQLVGIVDENTSDKIINLLTYLNPILAAHCFRMSKSRNSKIEHNLIKKLIDLSEFYAYFEIIYDPHDMMTKKVRIKKEKEAIKLMKQKFPRLKSYVYKCPLYYATFSLAKIGTDNVVKTLVNFLKSSEHILSVAYVVPVLKMLKSEKTEELLINLLKSKNVDTIDIAAHALCVLGTKKAVFPIVKAIGNCKSPIVVSLAILLEKLCTRIGVYDPIKLLGKREPSRFVDSLSNDLSEINLEREIKKLTDIINKNSIREVLKDITNAIKRISNYYSEEINEKKELLTFLQKTYEILKKKKAINVR